VPEHRPALERGLPFDSDDRPGAPRILFVGSAPSTHTHSWIGLLDGANFNVRLLSPFAYDIPPDESFQIRTYLSVPGLNLNKPLRRNLLYPERPSANEKSRVTEVAEESSAIPAAGVLRSLRQVFRHLRYALPDQRSPVSTSPPPAPIESPTVLSPAEELERRFVELMREWQPHIVHTLGMFEAGVWWHGIRKRHGLRHGLRWVMQLRGGSDLEINRYVPEQRARIAEMANNADQIVSDNFSNFAYLRELGVADCRFANIAPVPGTGGLEIPAAPDWQMPPSRRTLLVWPKAYNTQYALALPVIEAFKIAAEKLPATIRFVMLWTVQNDVKEWLCTLPDNIRVRCDIRSQVPREEVLLLLRQTRILLAPSLVDGRPNTMLEAMASGAFPIVSPLASIREIARQPDNVLFARNLYPTEIADAIVRAATDDDLVDRGGQNNLQLVREIANRTTIRTRVVEYYSRLCEDASRERQSGT
jgi:hypothetical protein